jgi:protein tyrosine/serine phosphatase
MKLATDVQEVSRRHAVERWMPWLIAVVIVLLCIAFVWHQWFDAYHLAVVKEGVLYRAGVRTPREFAIAVRKVHPKTVVRLIDETERLKEPFIGEAAYCQARGIAVVEMPIKLGGWPTSEELDAFLNVANDPRQQPVLVHCAQGVRRTGMMVAAYQTSILGYDREKAKAMMLTFRHSQRTVKDVEKFIDVYDAKKRTVPTDLPVGKE